MDEVNKLTILPNITIYSGERKIIEIPVKREDTQESVPLDTVVVKFKICDIDNEGIVHLIKTAYAEAGSNIAMVEMKTVDTIDIPQSKYRTIIEIQYNTGDQEIGKGYIVIQ